MGWTAFAATLSEDLLRGKKGATGEIEIEPHGGFRSTGEARDSSVLRHSPVTFFAHAHPVANAPRHSLRRAVLHITWAGVLSLAKSLRARSLVLLSIWGIGSSDAYPSLGLCGSARPRRRPVTTLPYPSRAPSQPFRQPDFEA
ncbi:hypothetical protein GGTG_03933 [Gaeumannomyces tritici R3-111a-1]|uniref:Uncharacterized protein n=1 Tax=Gaeumannomyces tritici (strain R3-111a-1) TaxID=644352 RepID=J3NRN2_GAET3|nr:hypothetical protein GGTG_03933 [Gaeumannomyces tritici R3-111a-1]EJT78838.1 hypothetical protein GGTG_03933 [Gaeumannomyces tritici R3-111a-1]